MFKRSHQIDTLFALLLYCMFALFSLLLVMIGSQIYKRITDESAVRTDIRMTISYVSNKIRAGDISGCVRIEERKGLRVLVLEEGDGELFFETMIYFHDGELKELLGLPGEEFRPDYGQVLIKIKDFNINEENGMFTIKSTCADNSDYTMYVGRHT